MERDTREVLSIVGCGIPFLTVIILGISIWFLDQEKIDVFAYLTGINTLLLGVMMYFSYDKNLWHLREPEVMAGIMDSEEYRLPFQLFMVALYISFLSGIISVLMAIYIPTWRYLYIPSVVQIICFIVTGAGLFAAFTAALADYGIDR